MSTVLATAAIDRLVDGMVFSGFVALAVLLAVLPEGSDEIRRVFEGLRAFVASATPVDLATPATPAKPDQPAQPAQKAARQSERSVTASTPQAGASAASIDYRFQRLPLSRARLLFAAKTAADEFFMGSTSRVFPKQDGVKSLLDTTTALDRMTFYLVLRAKR